MTDPYEPSVPKNAPGVYLFDAKLRGLGTMHNIDEAVERANRGRTVQA